MANFKHIFEIYLLVHSIIVMLTTNPHPNSCVTDAQLLYGIEKMNNWIFCKNFTKRAMKL